MNMKQTWLGRVANIILVAAMLAGVLIPGLTAAAQSGEALPKSVVAMQTGGAALNETSGSLTPEQFNELSAIAEAVTKAVVLDYATGKATLDVSALSGLDTAAKAGVKRFVSDLNAGRVGIAVVSATGETILFGNPAALDAPPLSTGGGIGLGTDANYWTRDSWGVHIYLDKYWTNLLVGGSTYAVGIITGVLVSIVCSSGVGCIVAGVMVTILWDIVRNFLMKHKPTTMAIRVPYPWKNKYLHITMYRSGYWYNNQWLAVKRIWP